MNVKTDIIINGGGTPGLALALILAEAGLRVAIIDPAKPAALKDTKESGRTTALMRSSLNILNAAGFTKPEDFGGRLQAMRIVDISLKGGKSQESQFPASDIGLKEFGYNIPNSTLRAFLFERAAKHKNIEMRCPDALHGFAIEGGQVMARLNDSKTIKAPLIVGADGRKSVVRTGSNIEVSEKFYGQSAITCIITHSKPHNETATEFHRPAGPLALVPLAGKRSSIVWVEKTEDAQEIIKLRRQDFINVLEERSQGLLGKIDLETNPESWPLSCIKAQRLIAPHAALIAEAAHVISPITAQGLNLSLRDVAALAEILIDGARAGIALSDPALLAQYERRRKLDVDSRVAGVDGMMHLVSTHNPALKILRRTGFKALDMITPAKKIAMQHGLAPSIDEGRLARGENP